MTADTPCSYSLAEIIIEFYSIINGKARARLVLVIS